MWEGWEGVGVKKRGWARFCWLLYIQGRREEGDVEREREKVKKLGKKGLYSMYHSLQYIIFTSMSCNVSCNVVVLCGVLLYCNDDWCVKDSVGHRSRQQWLIAKWLGLGVNLQLG